MTEQVVLGLVEVQSKYSQEEEHRKGIWYIRTNRHPVRGSGEHVRVRFGFG